MTGSERIGCVILLGLTVVFCAGVVRSCAAVELRIDWTGGKAVEWSEQHEAALALIILHGGGPATPLVLRPMLGLLRMDSLVAATLAVFHRWKRETSEPGSRSSS